MFFFFFLKPTPQTSLLNLIISGGFYSQQKVDTIIGVMCFYHQFATYLSCQRKWKRRTKLPESSSSHVGSNSLSNFLYQGGKWTCGLLASGVFTLNESLQQISISIAQTKDPWGLNTNGLEGREEQEGKVKRRKSWCSWQKGKHVFWL